MRLLAAILLSAATLCVSGIAQVRLSKPVPVTARTTAFDPPVAVDINPAPNVVEVNITAGPTTKQFRPGPPTNVYAYDNSIPGPTITAQLGDTVIVHFTNNLPEATTVHWHGIDLPAGMDGSHISQIHVQPGQTFDYQFQAVTAGMFWYHPHVRSFDQVERGLYGCVLVRDGQIEQPGTGGEAEHVVNEHVVVFDDILLDQNNQIVPAFSFTDPLQNAAYQLNGRSGNVLLVNGREARWTLLPVPNGQTQRWRILNAANTSFCRLDFHDAQTGLGARKLWQIGQDGHFLEQPLELTAVTTTAAGAAGVSPGQITEMDQGVLLQPGQRMDVMFTPSGNPGQFFTVQQTDWRRGRHVVSYGRGGRIQVAPDPMDGSYPNEPFVNLFVIGQDPGTGDVLPPAQLTTYPPLPGPSTGDLNVVLSHGNPDPQGNVLFSAQQGLPASRVTSLDAMDVEVGDIKEWVVTNRTAMDHPFHTHGFQFEVLQIEFQDDLEPLNPLKNFTWQPTQRYILDTVRCPPRPGAKGFSRTIARLRVHFDDTGRGGSIVAHGDLPTRPLAGPPVSGGWLFHCHMLEHAAAGMLSYFEVRDPGDPFELLGFSTPGTNGKPSLTARGTLTPGSTLNVDLVDAAPLTVTLLVVGVNVLRAPLFGGTLVPGPPHVFLPGWIGPGGTATWSLPWGNFPSGVNVYWQAAFGDIAAPQQVAMSNALAFTTL